MLLVFCLGAGLGLIAGLVVIAPVIGVPAAGRESPAFVVLGAVAGGVAVTLVFYLLGAFLLEHVQIGPAD